MARSTAPPGAVPVRRPHIRIRVSRARWGRGLREVLDFGDLLYFLVWRDLKVRYKQTVLGVAWAVLQPVLTAVVFSLFFGRLAGVPSDGIPYPLFTFAALVPWTFVVHGTMQASNSVVLNQQLITRVYFPRVIVPLATVTAGAVDFAIAFVVLLAMMPFWGITPMGRAVATVPFALLAFITATGVGLWLAALNVRYRDVRYVTPFLTQLWLFLTPIAYPSTLLDDGWRQIYALNPMVGVVEGFRWALLGTPVPVIPLTAVSAASAIVLLVMGAWYFHRVERTFADIL